MSDVSILQLNSCRVCDAPAPRRFLQLKDMPLMDGFVHEETKGSEFTGDISVYWCESCKTVQTQHDVDLSDYYLQDYSYTVSCSPFVQRYMRELAATVLKKYGFGDGASVIDIGSGDGYQLKCFQDLGAKVMGYEPSEALARASREIGVEVVECLFSHETTGEIHETMRPVDVVLLTYTLDHLPDPHAFLESVRKVMNPNRGILVIEVHDISKIIPRREACLFAHEHSVYLSAVTMERLLARAGFRMVDVDLVPESIRRGNSLLVTATPEGSSVPSSPRDMAAIEEDLESWPRYASFAAELESGIQNLVRYVRSGKAAGKRFAGYGAGGRATMMMAMSGLTVSEIDYICDSNPAVHDLISPRSHVPVAPPARLLEDPVDEAIVFPFGYLNEIRAQNAGFEARGGKLVSLLELMTHGA